jgi:two-component system sensor histidine kinase BarA
MTVTNQAHMTQPSSRPLRKRLSFGAQLAWMFFIAGVIMALVVSAAFAWVSDTTIQNLYQQQAKQAAESLAGAAQLALLFDSADNAQDAVNATLALPAMRYVRIVNAQGRALLEQGHRPAQLLPVTADKLVAGSAMELGSRNGAWHYVTAVYAENLESSNQDVDTATQPTLLGYAYLVQDQNELRQILFRVLVTNIIIGLVFTLMLVLLLQVSLKRLLRPLGQLTHAMEIIRRGERGEELDLSQAPSELEQIGDGYNSMVNSIAERDRKLREHNERLEREVEVRTHELVNARDDALDASRQKSLFLASISHELRTPLQSIIGYADITRENLFETGHSSQTDVVDRITENAHHLMRIINSILDLIRAESGRLRVTLRPTPITRIIEQARNAVMPVIERNGNTLEIRQAFDRVEVDIDETKMLQVMINLLGNAAKFTHDGKIRLDVELTQSNLRVAVSDTGIGIARDQLKRIFDPFRQAESLAHEAREYEGTGLGLSISRHFCSVLGGTINVESTPNRGSVFTVLIPLPINVDISNS